MKFNYYGFKAIYVHEMNRFIRTVGQSHSYLLLYQPHYILLSLVQLLELYSKN